MTSTPALRGVRVLERTRGGAGQVAGMLLADLGADVVRLIPGDGLGADIERTGRPGWLCWNRGKQLVAAPAELDRVLERADILLTDGPPSQHLADGLDGDSLRRRAPALVSIWMPPTGAHGRWSELTDDHLLLDALGGFAAHHPATEEVPVASVVPLRHRVQGALGALAALAGLVGREGSGWGRSATVSGLHAEAATLNTVVSRSIDGPPVISPGKFLPGAPNFRLYQAGDGRWMFLAALSPDLFIRALEVLDRLDILAHPDIAGEFLNVLKPDVGATVGAELDAAFRTASLEEWLDRFATAGVPASPVGDPADWLTSDVIAHACPPVEHAHHELGTVLMPGSPIRLTAAPAPAAVLADETMLGDLGTVWLDVDPLPVPSGPPPGPDQRPLDGVRIIDLATFLAAPFASTLCAAHGADVVKVEAPTGDPYAVFNAPYACINEHKPRLPLDLRDADGRSALLELVSRADVVVDNLVASSWARLGISHDDFEAANPGLIRCSVTAYGATGPYADDPGFDPIMQSLSGLVSIQGGGGRPIATAAPVHDVVTGAVAAVGTLAALWVKRRDGGGQRVFTSLAASSTFLQSAEFTTYAARPERPVGGADFPGPHPWQRFHRASDRWFAVSAVTADERRSFEEVVRRHGGEPSSCADLFGGRSCDEWVEVFTAADVPSCPAIHRSELDDAFLVENDYSHVVETTNVGRLEVVSGYTEWHDHPRREPIPVDGISTDRTEIIQRWGVRNA